MPARSRRSASVRPVIEPPAISTVNGLGCVGSVMVEVVRGDGWGFDGGDLYMYRPEGTCDDQDVLLNV